MPVSLSTAFAHGAAADRPTASSETEGFFYFSEDTGDFAQIQGGAWVTVAAVSGGGSGTLTVLKKATNYTLTAEDSGKLVVPTANDVVLTLPVASTGLHYTIVPWTDWAHPVKVRPQADEQIASLGERTLGVGVGIIADAFSIGFNAMALAGPLTVYATGAGEPWVVPGIAGAGTGIGWSSES